jgi:hypothetical protein
MSTLENLMISTKSANARDESERENQKRTVSIKYSIGRFVVNPPPLCRIERACASRAVLIYWRINYLDNFVHDCVLTSSDKKLYDLLV